jgi:hypothetical protein
LLENDFNSANDDKETLGKYLASLSDEDKKLIPDLLIDVGEPLLMEMDTYDFSRLINERRPDLEEQQQQRRTEIISKISDLQAWEKVHEDGRKYLNKLGNGNGDNNNNNDDIVELELSPTLKQSGIVTSFVLHRTNKAIELILNHKYAGKTVVYPVEIDKSSFSWTKFTDCFEEKLRKKGIGKEDVLILSNVLDDNWKKISQLLHKDSDKDSSSGEEKSTAQIALGLAEEQCSELFLDQFGTPYAAVKIDEHIETLRLKDSRFKNWLCRAYYLSEGKILNSESFTNVLNILKAKAEFEGVTRTLDLRVASVQDEPFTIYYDLSNKEWQVVKITPKGWSIEPSPIIFRRYKVQQPQVYPSRQYSPDVFDKFMDLMNIKDKDETLLSKGYIVGLFYSGIPKAISVIKAEQGSAKTTEHRLQKKLIDPSSLKTSSLPTNKKEMVQLLAHNYVTYFDNVSTIKDWQSDVLCRAATGDGDSKRELYTDDEDIIYDYKRCTGINGINIIGLRDDLRDRSILRKRERIAKECRRKEQVIDAEFETLRPDLLGYIFDILVKVLQVKSNGGIKLDGLPRMADFAEIAEIASRCMGYDENEFLKAYDKNIELQIEEAIGENLLSNAIVRFMEDKDEWGGTATVLLTELDEVATTKLKINVASNRQWPKAANVLSGRLKEVKTNLREIGIIIDNEAAKDPNTRVRTISICKAKGMDKDKDERNNKDSGSQDKDKDTSNDVRKLSFESLESFAEENHAQFSSDIPNDSNQAQRTDPSELGESFGKNDQNLAQNVGVNDPNDTLHTSQDGSPSYPGAEYVAKIREEMRRLTSKGN